MGGWLGRGSLGSLGSRGWVLVFYDVQPDNKIFLIKASHFPLRKNNVLCLELIPAELEAVT